MKLKVIVPFHDKDSFSTVYNVGQVVEFDEERALSVIGRGLATPFKETTEDAKEENAEAENENNQSSEEAETSDEKTEEVKEDGSQEPETVTAEDSQEEKPKRGRKPKKD